MAHDDGKNRSLIWASFIVTTLIGAGHLVSPSGLPSSLKIDCHPDKGPSEAACQARGCVWSIVDEHQSIDPNKPVNQIQRPPSCYFPANFSCFSKWMLSADDIDDWNQEPEFRWTLKRRAECPNSGFENDSHELELAVKFYGDSMMNIKIRDRHVPLFEPKLPQIKLPKRDASGKNRVFWEQNGQFRIGLSFYVLRFRDQQNTLELVHEPSDSLVFGIDLGKMIFSQQFIQLPTFVASPMIFGLGQHFGYHLFKSMDSLMDDHYAKSYTMFNYGHPPAPDGRTSYSTFPFYLNLFKLPRGQQVTAKQNLTAGQLYELRRVFGATGALMLSSNPMDVLLHPNVGQRPAPIGEPLDSQAAVTWRLVGGGIVDLYLFLGPRPEDVIRDYQSLVGRPQLPPAWSLGYHQSRMNYHQVLPIKMAWAKTRASGIPMESFWTDIDFMWRTTSYTSGNPDLRDLVDTLKEDFDMHYVALLDPAISVAEDPNSYEALKLAEVLDLFAYHERPKADYEQTRTRAVVVTWTDSKRSGVIDFTHPLIVNYLRKTLGEFEKSANFSGLWLDMNEPEVFANEPIDGMDEACAFDRRLQYEPANHRPLNDRTLCMEAKFVAGKHLNLHNLFAFYQSKAHHEALRKLRPHKRPFIISRSQFVGQGAFSGTWLGDLGSSFEQLRWSLVGTIESNMFGQPLVGADICGFFGAASDELCARWFSLGAFYPLARNHNDGSSKNQDPGSLGESVQFAAKVALLKRYSLLPYLYTAFHVNHEQAEPVIRSVLFEFFGKFDFNQNLRLRNLPQIDDQFMFGPAIMLAPVICENSESRTIYLPPGRWYDISIGLPGTHLPQTGVFDSLVSNIAAQGEQIISGNYLAAKSRIEKLRKPIDCNQEVGCYYTDQYTPIGSVNMYLRGGYIVPTFRWINHEKSVGQNWANASFFLEAAADEKGEATGSLYWDSGESDPDEKLRNRAHFWLSNNRLVIVLVEDRYEKPLEFNGFLVYGVESFEQPDDGRLIEHGVRLKYDYNAGMKTLSCTFESLDDGAARTLLLAKSKALNFRW